VESVLKKQEEQFERKCQIEGRGYRFREIVERVGKAFGIETEENLSLGKKPKRLPIFQIRKDMK
jgi:hypothetical protein